MFGLLLLKECDSCGGSETRLFTDSWSGLAVCAECLIAALPYTTQSPEEEGDNFPAVLREKQAERGESRLHCDPPKDDDDVLSTPHRS